MGMSMLPPTAMVRGRQLIAHVRSTSKSRCLRCPTRCRVGGASRIFRPWRSGTPSAGSASSPALCPARTTVPSGCWSHDAVGLTRGVPGCGRRTRGATTL